MSYFYYITRVNPEKLIFTRAGIGDELSLCFWLFILLSEFACEDKFNDRNKFYGIMNFFQ